MLVGGMVLGTPGQSGTIRIPIKTSSMKTLPKTSIIKGGSHYQVRKANVGGEVHHIISDSVSDIPTGKGPSLWMEVTDHSKTGSFRNNPGASDYRAVQKSLVEQGRYRDAAAMDLRNIRSNTGSKYNQGMLEAIDYMKTLPQFRK
jgi:hypothetical protein